MDKVGEYTLKIMRTASWYNSWLFELTKDHLGDEILEVGAGLGNMSRLLRKEGELTAIDINKDYVDSLRKKFKNSISAGFGDIETGKYFFQNRRFSTVVCLNVLEHIKKHNQALSNMYDLLEKKGRLILLVPAHQLLFSNLDKKLGHFRRYNKSEVKNLLKKAGFRIEEIRYLNWWAAVGWFVFLRIFGTQHLPISKVSLFDKLGKIFLWPEKFIEPPFGLSILAVAQKS